MSRGNPRTCVDTGPALWVTLYGSLGGCRLTRSGSRTHPNGLGGSSDPLVTVARVSRRLVIAVLAGVPLVALGIAAGVAFWPARLPELLEAPRSPILPDLAMSPLTDFKAGVAPDGDQYLSFTAAIANIGPGPFIVHAVRADEKGNWRVT